MTAKNNRHQGRHLRAAVIMAIFLSFSLRAAAQETTDTIRPTQWVEDIMEKPKLPLFQGFTVSGDLLGIGMKVFSDYASFEGALRLSLKNLVLPVTEIGYSFCDHTDYDSHIRYKTNAPYFRIGVDFNVLKNKFQDNRLMVGLRYGFSSYKFDTSGESITDPIWGGSQDFSFDGLTATSHWLEIVLGTQVKIIGCFHLGWSVRLKYHLKSTENDFVKPYYIPGYGLNANSNTWGGTFNLIFDLNWGKPKRQLTINN